MGGNIVYKLVPVWPRVQSATTAHEGRRDVGYQCRSFCIKEDEKTKKNENWLINIIYLGEMKRKKKER